MRFRRHHLGRVLAAIGLTAGSLVFTAAGPAAADVVEPFGKRYEETLHGDFTTLGNTVTACPTTPACAASPAPPAPGPQGGRSSGSMAATGGNAERLWLLGALAVALAAAGLVAKAALRNSRRD
ncbi:hypothetical protein [Streptomyces sp. NPDC093089]|uniref:hypothetical protein n=1 Tax=Streptomyces sp. NPDC093089 TaxID=3366024 RepID=UPI00380A3D94